MQRLYKPAQILSRSYTTTDDPILLFCSSVVQLVWILGKEIEVIEA